MATAPVRLPIFCGAILLFASSAFGAGQYQQTRDGKTTVWNDHPQPGDEATWSGDRDGQGYATGFGKLTWYTFEKEQPDRPQLYARFFGKMVRGKFDGPVNVHVRKTTRHAVFLDGKKVTRWVVGPVRSWRTPALVARETRPERTVAAEPEAPAEGPTVVAAATVPVLSAPMLPPVQFANDVDDSLRLVAWPPTSLRQTAAPVATGKMQPAARPPVLNPQRTKDEVMGLADAALRRYGGDPAAYEMAEPKYDPVDGTWLVFYEQKSDQGSGNPKHVAVAVTDRTKRTAVVTAR